MHLHPPNFPLYNIITFFVYLIIPFAAPLSFNFDSFSPYDPSITYERAYVEENVIKLTNSNSVTFGRATYSKPMQLWDKASGNLTDFTTHFSFIIDSQNRSCYGDGIAFFLAPAGSRLPNGARKGGTLGLTSDNQTLNSKDNPFVAVEFDIYPNPDWDPKHEHVGIDINSMESVNNVTWWSRSSILDGKKNDAWISYYSNSKTLSVIFTGFVGNTIVQQELYYVVDMRDHLPEWVTFGFSAATGNEYASQSILSWNFNSTLEIGNKDRSKRHTGLVVGLGVGMGLGGSVLVCGLVMFSLHAWKKNKRVGKEDEPNFGVNEDDDDDRRTIPALNFEAPLPRVSRKVSLLRPPAPPVLNPIF